MCLFPLLQTSLFIDCKIWQVCQGGAVAEPNTLHKQQICCNRLQAQRETGKYCAFLLYISPCFQMQLYRDKDSKGLSKIKPDWEPRLIAIPQTAELGSALWSCIFLTQVCIFQDVGRGTAPLQSSGALVKGEGGQPVWKTVKLVFHFLSCQFKSYLRGLISWYFLACMECNSFCYSLTEGPPQLPAVKYLCSWNPPCSAHHSQAVAASESICNHKLLCWPSPCKSTNKHMPDYSIH